MRGTDSAEIETFASTALLPPEALALLDQAAGVFSSRAWWDVVLSHAMPAGSEAVFVVIRSAGRIVALLPMLRTGGRLDSLTTPYTCEYTPLFADKDGTNDTGIEVLCQSAFAALLWLGRSAAIARFDALPDEGNGLANLQAGARQAGLRPLQFDHFGNWYEDVGDLDWAAYLLRRPGELRETIRRRLRKAEKLPNARFDLFTQPSQMDQATEAFESVYRRSWKQIEPYPTFNVALMRAMATLGFLRLGVWSIDGGPVAVQFWVVKAGHATVLKLAHDEAFKTHSPGTVLTALMLRHLLDHEGIVRIDFGRGDDAYKQGWAAQRRQRIGLLLVNPWRFAGLIELLRHTAGRLRSLPVFQPRLVSPVSTTNRRTT